MIALSQRDSCILQDSSKHSRLKPRTFAKLCVQTNVSTYLLGKMEAAPNDVLESATLVALEISSRARQPLL